jgi:hypothetical protein
LKVYSQLERAQLENLSSLPSAATAGRIVWNTTDLKFYTDDVSNWRALLRNDGLAVIGNNGTAANNVRFHRGANAVLQLVLASDATAEGTLSTSLAQISAKQESYTNAGKPTAANAGRVAWITDTAFLNVDTGSVWKVLVDSDSVQTLSNKTLTLPVIGGFSGTIAIDSTAGADQTLALPVSIVELTGALTSIAGITAPSTARLIVVTNTTGSDLIIKNDSVATAANRIITGTAANLTLANTANLWLYYDTTNSRWRIVGGSGGGATNSITSSLSLTGGGTITIVSSGSTSLEQTFLVAGGSAAVTLANAPFGASPPPDGAKIWLIGNSDSNTVTVPFVDAANGCLMDGDVTLAKGQTLGLMYSTTLARYVRIK